MQSGESAGEAHILKSELARRKRAVLMPAEPGAKRQRTDGTDVSGACARAQAYVPNSPLSPGRQHARTESVSTSNDCQIIEDAPDSADASSGQEGHFAVRTNSELEAAYVEQNTPLKQRHDSGAKANTAELATSAKPTETVHKQAGPDTDVKDGLQDACDGHAKLPAAAQLAAQAPTSQQKSTADAGSSEPSSTSQETKLMPSKQQADSALSSVAVAPAQISPPQPAAIDPHTQSAALDPLSQATVAQLLVSGPYACDADSQQSVAEKLKIYKAKVDEVHAMGKVSLLCWLEPFMPTEQSHCGMRHRKLTCCSAFILVVGIGYANNMTTCI